MKQHWRCLAFAAAALALVTVGFTRERASQETFYASLISPGPAPVIEQNHQLAYEGLTEIFSRMSEYKHKHGTFPEALHQIAWPAHVAGYRFARAMSSNRKTVAVAWPIDPGVTGVKVFSLDEDGKIVSVLN